jgi:hypothetical protein
MSTATTSAAPCPGAGCRSGAGTLVTPEPTRHSHPLCFPVCPLCPSRVPCSRSPTPPPPTHNRTLAHACTPHPCLLLHTLTHSCTHYCIRPVPSSYLAVRGTLGVGVMTLLFSVFSLTLPHPPRTFVCSCRPNGPCSSRFLTALDLLVCAPVWVAFRMRARGVCVRFLRLLRFLRFLCTPSSHPSGPPPPLFRA